MKKKESYSFSNFEKNIETLKKIVSEMEKDGIEIEKSLQLFEEGVALVRACQSSLKEAEQKVSILMEQNGVLELKPFVSETQQHFSEDE